MTKTLLRETVDLMNKMLEWHAQAYGVDYNLSELWNEFREFREKLLQELERGQEDK